MIMSIKVRLEPNNKQNTKVVAPKKQLRLVLAWTELHQDELSADWKLAMDSELPFKIEPLK